MCECASVKNITVSLDEELYRKSRIAAAEGDTTVTALVREFLTRFTGTQRPSAEVSEAVMRVIDEIRNRHPGFDPENRLRRDEVHAR